MPNNLPANARTQRPSRKRLSKQRPRLSVAPHAEVNFSQQDTKSGREAVQDYRPRQSFARAIVPASFALGQERQAQTPSRQNGARSQNGRSPGQGEPAVRLIANETAVSAQVQVMDVASFAVDLRTNVVHGHDR